MEEYGVSCFVMSTYNVNEEDWRHCFAMKLHKLVQSKAIPTSLQLKWATVIYCFRRDWTITKLSEVLQMNQLKFKKSYMTLY